MSLRLVCLVLALTAGSPPIIGAAEFLRGININGPSLVIDGRRWEAGKAPGFEASDRAFENQKVALNPPVEPERARMLRASTYTGNGRNRLALTVLPPAVYSVFLHVWEDNKAAVYDVFLNGRKVVSQHHSGTGGSWHRLGPWIVEVADGRIELTSRGGHANWSGLELWKGRAEVGARAGLAGAQVEFFEAKVRPLLAAKCYGCHSRQAERIRGGLLLDTRVNLLRGGDGGPVIVPGNPDGSRLIKAVGYRDKHLQMPPADHGGPLAGHEIAALTEWVRQGAPDPRDGEADLPPKFDLAEARRHWAYRPVRKPDLPVVTKRGWARNDVDRFVLARQEAAGVRPNPDAAAATLIRRAFFDLIGLPPSREQLRRWTDRFEREARPAAMAALVDELLASRHYGERWGRHWMDLVRYADTAGDNSDYPVPQLHRYRDYIVAAFNQDKPYDQFVREQLAGDLLPAADQAQRNEQVIATGYIAGARRFGSVVDRYPTHLTIEDTIDNLSRTFLGLTLGCARCHDHKFEALSSEDYYGIYGMFASTRYAFPGIELLKVQKDFVPLVDRAEQDRLLGPFRKAGHKLQQNHDQALARRNGLEKEKARIDRQIAGAKKDGKADLYRQLNEVGARIVTARRQIRTAAEALEKHRQAAPPIPDAYAVTDGTVADARIQLKGEPSRLGAEVPRKFLDVLGGQRLEGEARAASGRLQLAGWIADAANPLTARVMVNRVWQHHFGRGLVPLPSNFGQRGLPPSHPALLDWLAREFVAGGWSFKHLHRLVMNSRTYQLASTDEAGNLAVDADNGLLWRQNRRRLDAEQLRDAMMFAGGSLDLNPPAGPHPFPLRKKWAFTQHHPFKDRYPTDRRAVYQMTKRLTGEPYWQTFDGPDPNASTADRDESVTTVQSLFLMNDEFVHAQSRALAGRLLRETRGDRIRAGFEIVAGRPPAKDEYDRVEAFLAQYRRGLAADGCAPDEAERRTWEAFGRVLFRLNGFLYVD